jgi:hypothetical protein
MHDMDIVTTMARSTLLEDLLLKYYSIRFKLVAADSSKFDLSTR